MEGSGNPEDVALGESELGREGRLCCGSVYVCGKSRWGCPLGGGNEWLEEVPILGENQVQLRPAESESPRDSQRDVREAAGKLGVELQGEAWAAGGNLGVGWYLKS